MGYWQILNQTYEKAREYVGKKDSTGMILLPIAHSTQNAQVEIALGLSGQWKGAKKVEKADAVTIIPVTEDSGSRSSGIAPHPLLDKLCYLAGDYSLYCHKKKAGEFYPAYIRQLEQWVEAGCHPYVKAIYAYLKKETLVHDLVEAGVLVLDETGLLSDHEKIEGIDQDAVFIRFRIQDEKVKGTGEVWRETALYDDYISYYVKQFDQIDLDYMTGEFVPVSEKQPSKIRNSGDKAKLISANDSHGFTYRGRFASKEEAVRVGYIPSQQAHNVLRWLIERQSYRKYGMCILTWNPELKEVPDWVQGNTHDIAYGSDEEPEIDLGENYAKQVSTAIEGRYSQFQDPAEEIVVMLLEAATPGRLAVTYFQQMKGSVFLDYLIYWHTSCCWYLSYLKTNLKKNIPFAPEPEDIIRAAYGVERNNNLQVEEKMMQASLKRLLPCIIRGQKIPPDIVQAAFENAIRPMGFGTYNRRKILDIACALIRKQSQDNHRNKKGEYDAMSLDRTRDVPDYLYGRLWAVYYKMEYDTFTDEEKGRRETNADRYRALIVKEPGKAWMMMKIKIQPYRRKLNIKAQNYYDRELQEISDLFDPDKKVERNLGQEFLIAYNCQLSEMWRSKKEEKEKE